MDDTILQVAQERFGLSYLFPYQRLVISNILAAAQSTHRSETREEDAESWGHQVVILPTGAGKSLCFQLPAAVLPGATLVVYPLLSLMNDQARRMQDAGFSIVQLKGGQSTAERSAALESIREGTVDFIITNPETLQHETIRNTLGKASLVHVVVDEAHCISEWGDAFRPLYLTLGPIIQELAVPVITAFTATAGDHVLARITDVLFPHGSARIIRGNPDRENISYSVVPCLSTIHAVEAMVRHSIPGKEHPLQELPGSPLLPVWRPGEPLPLPAIIFCRTRTATMRYAARIATALGSSRVMYYHAGLDRQEKRRVEELFFESSDGILCSTCAYGMGVDKANVRAVVHTYLPDTVEAFLQESGRGGRDRNPALSILLVDPAEEIRFRSAGDSASVVQSMAFGTTCRREPLLEAMGTHPDACAGCDVCVPSTGGEHYHTSRAAEILVRAGEWSARRLRRNDLVRLLRGTATWQDWVRGLPAMPGFRLFASWRTEDLEEAVQHLVALGRLSVRQGFIAAGATRKDRRRAYRQSRRATG